MVPMSGAVESRKLSRELRESRFEGAQSCWIGKNEVYSERKYLSCKYVGRFAFKYFSVSISCLLRAEGWEPSGVLMCSLQRKYWPVLLQGSVNWGSTTFIFLNGKQAISGFPAVAIWLYLWKGFCYLHIEMNHKIQSPSSFALFFPDLWHLHLFVVYFSSHFVTLGTKLLLQVKGNVWISAAMGPNHFSFILWTNAVSQLIAQTVQSVTKERTQNKKTGKKCSCL